MIFNAVFVPAIPPQTKFFTLQKSLEKSREYAKDICPYFVEPGNNTTGFVVKNFGECCGSMVLMAPVAGRQVAVFLLRRLCRVGKVDHNRPP